MTDRFISSIDAGGSDQCIEVVVREADELHEADRRLRLRCALSCPTSQRAPRGEGKSDTAGMMGD